MTTRFRSRSVQFEPSLACSMYNHSTSSTTTYGTGPHVITKNDTMEDEVSPGYFSARRRGQFLPINPMTQAATKWVASSGSAEFEVLYNGNPTWDLTFTGHLGWYAHTTLFGSTMSPPSYASTPSWPSRSVLVTEALANARTRGFDILTFLAEFRKTMDLIARFRDRTLRRAEKIADTIGKSADPLAEFSAVWLEARYGWRILAYDMEGINESIERLKQIKPPFIRGYASDSNSAEYNLNYALGAYMRSVTPYGQAGDYGRCSISINQVKERETRAGVVLEALLDDIFEVDPLVTAWEVIPFSFIVDWFVNIGDVVAAYSPFATENLLGAWSKETEKLITTGIATPGTMGNPTSGWYYSTSDTTPHLTEVINLSATRRSESPSASLSFRVNLDELKLVDLASIFITRWGKILGGLLKSTRI